ncbi:hypothetical protein [Aquabacterium sp.]|uniref:hypothetical protein n=1 Tax=Aquabacterium sp. TaxID=1872578 RepID=UPI0025BBEA3F|nr:hypothetical protein [Aquabacterium sp.]
MSTKCSIAHGTGFHLYNEVFDDEHVFLQLDKAAFEATPDSVMVKLPLHVWEHIRSFPGADLSDSDLSDEQIHEEAIKAVDSRLAQAAKAKRGEIRNLIGTASDLVMGGIDLPRDQQILNYVAHRQRQRAQQQEVLARVEALKTQHS